MRMFLPIKGPGGRYLTPNEKIALLILGLTLVLGVLTLLAGEAAYLDDGAQNPVFGFVALLCRGIGGGIIALYALVLVWSGLIYFKGERVADVAPLGGRMFAAIAVTVGVSGALGIAQLESAGRLGSLVGGALDHTLGGAVGFPVLLMLMLLGFHLAGQGAWTALREPMALAAATATATATPSPHAAFGYGLSDPVEHRIAQDPPMPDDGDPTADERSLAVKQAMEEIERSQGVTIVDVEPEIGVRPSIGEDVEAAPAPAPETEEAEVQSGLESVADALRTPVAADAAGDRDEETVEDRDDDAHGLVPVPPSEIATEDQEYEDDEEEAEYEDEEDDDAEDEAEYEEDEEDVEDEEDEEDEDEADEDEAEYEDEDTDEEEERTSAEDDEEETEVEDAETGFAKAASAEEDEDLQADGFAEPESDDPYARGGLLRRMQRPQVPVEDTADDDRTFTTFDWRGRPLD